MLHRLIRNRQYLPYCFEALLDLIICKLFIVFIPFRWYAKKYGHPHCETLQEDMQTAAKEITAIHRVFRALPAYIPWRSKCLDQAMAAQRMLQRRGLQSTIYFGMAREKSNQALVAHAWLRCGNRWIVGYQPNVEYSIVGTYAWF